MQLPSRFNVRVYGIWLHDSNVLVNEELIHGRKVIKFPGGGLELGEGIADGLMREWREELNLDIQILQHYYTTDFFQPSAFDDSQVISIYYLVQGNDPLAAIMNNEANERTYWMPLSHITTDTFTLPIDKIVGSMLMGYFPFYLSNVLNWGLTSGKRIVISPIHPYIFSIHP